MRKWAALALLVLIGCSRAPSDAQIDRELAEARSENEAVKIEAARDEASTWTLSIRGNVTKDVELPWTEIEKRATSHVKTTAPTHTADVHRILDYRGLIIADLLKEFGATDDDGPGGHDVTIIAADGYRATRTLETYRKFPTMLAIEEDGVPLVRRTGGPLLEVWPHTSHPESAKQFSEGGAFYVTTLIVGTEKLSVDIGGQPRDARDLDGLPQRSVSGKVGFRSRWTTTGISIHGPLLRDLVEKFTKTPLDPKANIVIGRRPHVDVGTRQTMTIAAADAIACDIILGTRYGDDRTPIAAGQGGPAIVAFPRECADSTKNQPWPLFVDSIAVTP